MTLLAIEALDGVTEATFGVDLWDLRQGIIDSWWPSVFFERSQNGLLVLRRRAILLDDDSAPTQLVPYVIPVGSFNNFERLSDGQLLSFADNSRGLDPSCRKDDAG